MPAAAGSVEIVCATEDDLADASSILVEAARWLERRGLPLWRPEDLAPERLRGDVAAGSLHVARRCGEAVGTIALSWEDPVFWPDATPGESAFVHRLAVRRAVAGTGVAAAMLAWAKQRAIAADRRWLRLDCSARHEGLCAFYEKAGFERCGARDLPGYRGALFRLPLEPEAAP